MPRRRIQKNLQRALLEDGEMDFWLYEYELAEHVDELVDSMRADRNHAIFAVTEKDGLVAMVLIESDMSVHVNEEARERLRQLWPAAYESNRHRFLPDFAKQLDRGEFPVFGFTVME